MRTRLSEPIKFGGCCDKCGRPKISCVCIQNIIIENPKKKLEGKTIELKVARTIKREALRKIIEEQYLKMYSINDVNMVRKSDIDDLVNAIINAEKE